MMRRWFLSYNSQDLPLVQAFEAALRSKDPQAHIFYAPKTLRAGGFWLPELAERIAEATAFVLLVGAGGVGPWQSMEYYEALDRRVKEPRFPVILVLLDGQPAPGLPFLRQVHWLVTPDLASEKTLADVLDAGAGGGGLPREPWRHTAPYRGLSAMTEADADYFFGRGEKTAEVLGTLAETPNKLPLLLGNSGVGKSSLAQAGVTAALMRQAWPQTAPAAGAWPQDFRHSRRWCFLKLRPGAEPVRALVEPFLRTWQFEATASAAAKRQREWVRDLLDGSVTLPDLLDATEARYRDELQQPAPPAFLLYVDQGEELYVRAAEEQRRRFSQLLAGALGDPRLRAMISLRADFYGDLQKDEALYAAHRLISVPPLREAELRDVVSRPAELLAARFETDQLANQIAQRTAEEAAKDAGALPLLSYLLDDMWAQMVQRGDGVLRLPAHAIELGAVLVQRADALLAAHPEYEDDLRRILTLKLATVREDGEPTRRRATRSEFNDQEWRLASELADHPYRLLVTAAPENAETYAEVGHEAIFRRWDRLRDWIAAEREFLIWKSGLESARRAWQAAPAGAKNEALLMGLALRNAQSWLAKRSEDIPPQDREFIVLSHRTARRRALRAQAGVGVLVLAIVAGLIGWFNQAYLEAQWRWLATERPYMTALVRPYVLGAAAENALKPLDSFRECARACPEMVVIPAGTFVMGSPKSEAGHDSAEEPQHTVTIARSFAASRFDVTFDDWDACVAYGDCDPLIGDGGWGRGRQPAINVTWHDASRYAAWLARMTGKPYRLLSEAEWEYAARAGTTTGYSFGDDAATLDQFAWFDGNSESRAHPVGEKRPNAFGLYDMHGNVFQWVEDCLHGNYSGAPEHGSAWIANGDCSRHIVRGGSWDNAAQTLRSAYRYALGTDVRYVNLGFRVGRTLAP